jgi:hypothetical protein
LRFCVLRAQLIEKVQFLFEAEGQAGGAEGQWGKLIPAEKSSLVGVISGMELTAGDCGSVNQNDICPTLMFAPGHQVEQAKDVDVQAGFFQAFAGSSLRGVFAGIHKAGWKGPIAHLWLVNPAHQQHFAFLLNQHPGSHFWIFKIHPATFRAFRTRRAKKQARPGGRAAVRAKMDWTIFHFFSEQRLRPAAQVKGGCTGCQGKQTQQDLHTQ